MIYFDNSATTKPYPEALQSYVTVAGKYFGNPSSIHSLGGEAERLLTQSRTIAAAPSSRKTFRNYFHIGWNGRE